MVDIRGRISSMLKEFVRGDVEFLAVSIFEDCATKQLLE
jgi:hypothetical protein